MIIKKSYCKTTSTCWRGPQGSPKTINNLKDEEAFLKNIKLVKQNEKESSQKKESSFKKSLIDNKIEKFKHDRIAKGLTNFKKFWNFWIATTLNWILRLWELNFKKWKIHKGEVSPSSKIMSVEKDAPRIWSTRSKPYPRKKYEM